MHQSWNNLITLIRTTLQENVNQILETEGVTDILTIPVKGIDCNLSDWADVHGIKLIHLFGTRVGKHSLIIILTDHHDSDTHYHILITIQPNKTLDHIKQTIKSSSEKEIRDLVNTLVNQSITFDHSPTPDKEQFLIENYDETRIKNLLEIIIQMMKDGLTPESIMDWACGYRGVILRPDRIDKKELEKYYKHREANK